MSDLLCDPRKDNITDISPEVVLPGQLALRVHQQVLHELCPGISVAFVEWVLGESLYPVLRLVEDQLTVVAVTLVEEVAGLVLEDGGRLVVVLRREDPAGLKKSLHTNTIRPVSNLQQSTPHPANELVGSLEPSLELFIGSSVVLELRDGVEEPVKGTLACKALEENAELLPCLLHDRVVAEHALGGTPLLLAGRFGGIEVCLERVEEPSDRALVRRVGLALGNDLDNIEYVLYKSQLYSETHLLHAPDELITAVLGELLIEKLLSAVGHDGSAFFVLP